VTAGQLVLLLRYLLRPGTTALHRRLSSAYSGVDIARLSIDACHAACVPSAPLLSIKTF